MAAGSGAAAPSPVGRVVGGLGRWRERLAADVPAERGAVPGRERAAARSSRTATARWSTTCSGSPDPAERLFGSVGIREGYEVGDHGAQSLYRVGCRVQLTEVEAHADGTFDIVAVGLDRIQLERLDTTGTFPVGHVVADAGAAGAGARGGPGAGPRHVHGVPRRARPRSAADPYDGDAAPRPDVPLLDAGRRARRCRCTSARPCSRPRTPPSGWCMVTDLLRAELRAMNVIPSLPATEVARTRWSPN